jgi:hypothetical protein
MEPVTVRAAPQKVIFIRFSRSDKPDMRWLQAAAWLAALTPTLWLTASFHDIPHLGRFHTDAVLAAGAHSLATGGGYQQAHLPGKPAQTKYPPLYPLWLSMGWGANPYPANRPALLILSVLWLPIFALLAAAVFRDLGFEDESLWMLSALLLLTPAVVLMSVSLMPDLMMAALLLASLVLAERGRAAASGALAGLAYLVKVTAMPALIAVPIVFGARRQHRRAFLFALSAWPAFLAWNLWAAQSRAAGTQSSYYSDYVGFYLSTGADPWHWLGANIPGLLMAAGRVLAAIPESGSGSYLAATLGLAAFLSLARLGGRLRVYHAFTFCYLPMTLAWNHQPDERLLIPLVPLLLAGVLMEMRRMGERSRWLGAAVTLLALLLMSLNTAAIFGKLPSMLAEERLAAARRNPAYRWLRTETPPSACVTATRDALLYLETGRHATALHGIGSSAIDRRRAVSCRYLLLDAEDLPDLPATGFLTLFSQGPVRILTLQSERDWPVSPPAAPRPDPRRGP